MQRVDDAADLAVPAWERLATAENEFRDLQERIRGLERDNADLRALIIDLYSRTGQPYPHEGSKGATRTGGAAPKAASGGDATGRGQVAAGGERPIAVARDNTGVTSTGDGVVNIQNR